MVSFESLKLILNYNANGGSGAPSSTAAVKAVTAAGAYTLKVTASFAELTKTGCTKVKQVSK